MIPNEVVGELKSHGNKLVLIQLPEGLKTRALEIAEELKANGFEPVVSGDMCFGACDLKFLEGATTLHIGHSKMIEGDAVYWEWHYEQDLVPAAEKALPLLGEAVGLFTTVQHLNKISEAEAFLEKHGKKVFTAPGRTTKEFQVLGCDVAGVVELKEKVDSFLYIGGGRFHPIGMAYYSKNKVIAADPFSLEIQEISPHIWEKERALRQTKAMNAKSYGIVVSSKPGQSNWAEADKLKQKLRDTITIYAENITPETLLPYQVDAFVITGCPRIVVDDWKSYKKPILLPDEA